MRLLCLYFPRLEIEIALRHSPHLSGRSIALLSRPGEDGLVTAVSARAAGHGLMAGMVAAEARRRDPGCVFLPDNAGAAFDELERIASIIRRRSTPLVEVGGTSHLFVDLESMGDAYASEAMAARRLQQLAGAWAGMSVRVGAGSTRGAARAAAMRGIFSEAASDGGDNETEPPVAPFVERTLSVSIVLKGGMAAPGSRETAARALARLQAVLDARAEAFREVRICVDCGDGPRETVERYLNPVGATDRALSAIEAHACDSHDGAPHAVRVTLGRLCPGTRDGMKSTAGEAGLPGGGVAAGPRARFLQMMLRAAG